MAPKTKIKLPKKHLFTLVVNLVKNKKEGFLLSTTFLFIALIGIFFSFFSRIALAPKPTSNFLYFTKELSATTTLAQQMALRKNMIIKLEITPLENGGVSVSLYEMQSILNEETGLIKKTFTKIKNQISSISMTIESTIKVSKKEANEATSATGKKQPSTHEKNITTYFFPKTGTCEPISLILLKKNLAENPTSLTIVLNSFSCRFEVEEESLTNEALI